MAWVDSFKEKIKELSPGLFPKENLRIKIVASSSVDSLIASAFLIKTFQNIGFNFSSSFYKKINDMVLIELTNDPANLLIFINPQIGSTDKITLITRKKSIIIESSPSEPAPEITIISPSLINYETSIPAAALAYLLCKSIYPKILGLSYLIPIAYTNPEIQPPDELVQEALIAKRLEVKGGLSIIISQALPLHKAIASTLCPYYPRLSGSEDSAVNLLLENNIPLRQENRFRSLMDLNQEETKKLMTALAIKRLGSEKNPDIVISKSYILLSEDENSTIKDIKGFQFLIDACLAYSKPSIAIEVCFNPKNKYKAAEFTNNFVSSLVSTMEYYLQNKSSLTFTSENIAVLNLGLNLDYRFLHYFARMITNSNFLGKKFIAILVLNPIGEICCSLSSQYEENPPELAQLIKNISRLTKTSIDQNTFTIKSDSCTEEELIKKLLEASQNLIP